MLVLQLYQYVLIIFDDIARIELLQLLGKTHLWVDPILLLGPPRTVETYHISKRRKESKQLIEASMGQFPTFFRWRE